MINKTTMNIDASVPTIENIMETTLKIITAAARPIVILPMKECLSKQFAAKINIIIDSTKFIGDTS